MQDTKIKTEIEILLRKIEDFIQKNPEKTAKILAHWIQTTSCHQQKDEPSKKAA